MDYIILKNKKIYVNSTYLYEYCRRKYWNILWAIYKELNIPKFYINHSMIDSLEMFVRNKNLHYILSHHSQDSDLIYAFSKVYPYMMGWYDDKNKLLNDIRNAQKSI